MHILSELKKILKYKNPVFIHTLQFIWIKTEESTFHYFWLQHLSTAVHFGERCLNFNLIFVFT